MSHRLNVAADTVRTWRRRFIERDLEACPTNRGRARRVLYGTRSRRFSCSPSGTCGAPGLVPAAVWLNQQ
nr:hypothetical protein [Streptomyces sp. 2131.1]